MERNQFCISLQHMPYLLEPRPVRRERWEVRIESCCDKGSCGLSVLAAFSVHQVAVIDDVWTVLHCLL